ncbi:uncharacterized protein [Epargyreus clarus]|uniref:uncharacterized protein n=1 Tax=Epargyreus clarus TaxID=520877 RepID=UPI003C2AF43F
MAAQQRDHVKSIATILLLTLHITASAKQSARPVHEVIEVVNEQARIDEKPRITNPGSLPYGNPLAGNIKQNIRLHAHNQQAMFNAERMRQHKAQLQRWTKAPQLVDSYMKAYHESQESHQLALEQQQATLIDVPVTKAPRRRGSPKPRQETLKSGISPLQIEPMKITKADAVKTQRNRNHRSYGSVEHHQYLQPKKYKTIYVSPAPTYDQGVTIKPNGNVGFTHLLDEKQNNLYTQAVPSVTKYVYPKHFSQMQSYHSAQDIDTLNSLLNKNPHEQLSEFNALLTSTKENAEESGKNNLDTPIDLYFYLKDPSLQTVSQHYDSSKFAQVPTTYGAGYLNDINALRDHTPITEDVDDIEDTNQVYKPIPYTPQPIVVTPAPDLGTTTIKSNNYYKVEVASQTITAGHAQNGNKEEYLKGHEEKPYEALYGQQPTAYYVQDTKQDGDLSERYLHHNAQHKGVQHLSGDGVGVSAYGDENLQYAANYEFGYRVRDQHSGNDFGHQEAKAGAKTNGHYHVLLPDGRMQMVKYSAGPDGFHADITYDHMR